MQLGRMRWIVVVLKFWQFYSCFDLLKKSLSTKLLRHPHRFKVQCSDLFLLMVIGVLGSMKVV